MKTKRERELEKALRELCEGLVRFEDEIDFIMKEPMTLPRDKKLARTMNDHSLLIQQPMHFTLGYSFDKIKKMYKP